MIANVRRSAILRTSSFDSWASVVICETPHSMRRRRMPLPTWPGSATLKTVSQAVREPTLPPPTPARPDRSRIRVRRFAGPIGFQDSLEHLRIAHLTDLHV